MKNSEEILELAAEALMEAEMQDVRIIRSRTFGCDCNDEEVTHTIRVTIELNPKD